MKTDKLLSKVKLLEEQIKNDTSYNYSKFINSLNENEIDREFEIKITELCKKHRIKSYSEFKEFINRKSFVNPHEYLFTEFVRKNLDELKPEIESFLNQIRN